MADMKAIMQQLSMQEQYDENAKWLNFTKTVFGKHSYQDRGRL